MNSQAMYETLQVVEWLMGTAEAAAWVLPLIVLGLAVAMLIRPRLADVRVSLHGRPRTTDTAPNEAFEPTGESSDGLAETTIDGVRAAGSVCGARRAVLLGAPWAGGPER